MQFLVSFLKKKRKEYWLNEDYLYQFHWLKVKILEYLTIDIILTKLKKYNISF